MNKYLLTLAFTILLFPLSSFTQENIAGANIEKPLLETKKDVKSEKWKKKTYMGFSFPFYGVGDKGYSFNNTLYGANFNVEIQYHPYISFTDTTLLLAMSRPGERTAFIFGYYLGTRFYLGTPYIFVEQRLGLLDHFKYWEGQYYFDFSGATQLGVSYPITDRIKFELSLEVQYLIYSTLKTNESHEKNIQNKLGLGTHIGMTFLI